MKNIPFAQDIGKMNGYGEDGRDVDVAFQESGDGAALHRHPFVFVGK
jgi:hypothetical protein